MKHPVKLTLDSSYDRYYNAYDNNGVLVLDLCEKHIVRLWPETKDAKNIVVTVSDKRQRRGSKPIHARINNGSLYWASKGMGVEGLDRLAGTWLLERFPMLKDGEFHTIFVSAIPE